MLFVFLCLAILLLLFYNIFRSMDDLVRDIREERELLREELAGIRTRMDEMVKLERELRDTFFAAVAHSGNQERYEDETGENITNFIVPE